jgi:tetratricopeptide (TPR) repeat protein
MQTLGRDDSYGLGLQLAREGRHAEAIRNFEAALRESPEDSRVLFALGNTAVALGHPVAAENFFRRVLAQEPDRLEALVNLANLLRKGSRTGDVVALLKPAIERNPAFAELWLTLGSALREAGDAETAETFYREALRLSPDYPAATGNLADLLADKGALAEALALYGRVIAAEPKNAQAHLNRAVLHFLNGDLKHAWRDYEHRLAIAEKTPKTDHGLKRWDGRIAKGLRLAVTAEQGVGDQIMFASLIPDLATRLAENDATLLLEAEPRLVPLFARSFPSAQVHAAKIEAQGGTKYARYAWLKDAGGADAAVPLGSLGGYMREDLSAFPSPHAYLVPDASERARWRDWLTGQGEGPYVGLCWRSGSLGGIRNLQYAPLQEWAAFVRDLPGTPVSLQYDGQTAEIESLTQLSGRTILVPPALDQKQELDRTIALMANLHAVVTAPTAVAWMAAGVGVPTFKMLYSNSWTSCGLDYEPFAPSCRCVMPAKAGDWRGCFAKASALLTARP